MSVYRSTYMTQYRKHKSTKSNPIIRQGQIGIIQGKMDLETVNRSFYRPHAVQSPPDERPVTSKPPLKFVGKSSYKLNFPDWGPVEALKEKQHQAYRTSELKFNGESTYKSQFTTKSPGRHSPSKALPSSKSIIEMNYDSRFETTTQKHYRSVSTKLRGPSYENAKNSVYFEVPADIYQTESRRAFQHQRSLFKDPKAMKRNYKVMKS